MPARIVLLSGPVAAGKSRLSTALVKQFDCLLIKTHHIIEELRGTRRERHELQAAGEGLDSETGGRWVAEALGRRAQSWPEGATIVVDAVRRKDQVDAVRRAFGHRVTHIHLTAPLETLVARYHERQGAIEELPSYDAVRADPTEAMVEDLQAIADVVIDTHRNSASDVAVRVASRLCLFGRSIDRLVDVLVGGQYGSEGKGQVAAYLAPEYDVLVRVGGPNAGHRVYAEPDPLVFHHLPSGSVVADRAKILLGPGAVIWLQGLLAEINDVQLDVARLFIDPNAMLIEQADRDFEGQTLTKMIGSTGQGVGSATARKVLRGAEPNVPVRLAKDESLLAPFVRPTREILDAAYARGARILLEGTQGTGLSLHHGAYPHVTSRDTTVSGCLAEAGIAPSRVRRILMICRTYPIRVESPKDQTSGPMSNELDWPVIAERSGIPLEELVVGEKTSTTKRKRRVAEFDWTLLRQAASLNGPTDIALTFADYLSVRNREARRFEQLTNETIRFIEEVERVARAPVSLIATRFHFRSVIDRRDW